MPRGNASPNFLCDMQVMFEARGVQAISLNLPMTRTDIGDYLGMCLETVSRALTALCRLGLIEPQSEEVLIVDLARLKVVAGHTA